MLCPAPHGRGAWTGCGRSAGSISSGSWRSSGSISCPQFNDDQGRLFGLFTLDFYDNSLHFASGAWAAIAALWSRDAAATYFRIFGPLYFLDGVMGFFLGSGYLDGGIFLYGLLELSWTIRFFANVPHLIIGGLAAWIGYRLARTPRAGRRVKKRWKILLGLGGTFLASALAPIAYVETQCRSPQEGLNAEAPFRSRLPGAGRAAAGGADLAHLSRMDDRLFGRDLRPLSRRRQPAERLRPLAAGPLLLVGASAPSTAPRRRRAAPATTRSCST